MGGGLLQLVAYGAQDVYLTSNPQITFFKVVYRRHTNFSMESIQQTFNGTAQLGRRVTAQISRNGDLIHKMYLEFDVKTKDNADTFVQPYFVYKMIKNIELEIGGQRIDKQYGEWMYIWNELSLPEGKRKGYNEMVGSWYDNYPTKLGNDKNYKFFLPLEFWFCRNVGLALPLIALQYHEVKLNIEFNEVSEIMAKGSDNTNSNEQYYNLAQATPALDSNISATTYANDFETFQANLWVDYIFLDTDERRRFAQMSHEYLIEQVQHTGSEKVTAGDSLTSYRMNFNHPVKELIWYVKPDEDTGKKSWWNNFSNGDESLSSKTNPVKMAKIMFNGNDRFAQRDGNYFSMVQPYQHHTNIPQKNRGINVYSFALKPEEHQVSGTANFSRLDTTTLQMSSEQSGQLYIYAVNYNVLRILSGMGGLAYSN